MAHNRASCKQYSFFCMASASGFGLTKDVPFLRSSGREMGEINPTGTHDRFLFSYMRCSFQIRFSQALQLWPYVFIAISVSGLAYIAMNGAH
jgi:hypothetical protein